MDGARDSAFLPTGSAVSALFRWLGKLYMVFVGEIGQESKQPLVKGAALF
jgi:hypothetical protein